jgi:hypothetical protein
MFGYFNGTIPFQGYMYRAPLTGLGQFRIYVQFCSLASCRIYLISSVKEDCEKWIVAL